MVVQLARISSVLGLGGTLGAWSLLLDLTDSASLWSETLGFGLAVAWREGAADTGLWDRDWLDPLEAEKSLRLDSPLTLYLRLSEAEAALSGRACGQVSDRTSRDWALWIRPGTFGPLL